MKTSRKAWLLALLIASPAAWAQDRITLEDVAQETGLSVRQVKMVLGPSSAYPEFRTSYHRAKAQLIRAYGQDGAEDLAQAFRAGELSARDAQG